MRCPKCKAKVGVVRDRFMLETGLTCGVQCFICGYWVQEFPSGDEWLARRNALHNPIVR
jgi:hypothetical protein